MSDYKGTGTMAPGSPLPGPSDELVRARLDVISLARLLGEARELLWRLRHYDELEDSDTLENAGIELSKAFDDWYARNPDPNKDRAP